MIKIKYFSLIYFSEGTEYYLSTLHYIDTNIYTFFQVDGIKSSEFEIKKELIFILIIEFFIIYFIVSKNMEDASNSLNQEMNKETVIIVDYSQINCFTK